MKLITWAISLIMDVIFFNCVINGVSKMSRALSTVCTVLLLPGLLWADGQATEKQANPNIRVTVSSAPREAIELEVTKARLSEVIEQIASKSGVRVHYSVLPEALVTATCAGESLKQVMECLLGANVNLMFKYPNGLSKTSQQGRPEELWIVGSSFAKGENGARPGGAQAMTEQAKKKRTSIDPDHLDKHEVKRLLKLAGDEDPSRRASALSQLTADGRINDESYRKVLETALTDKAPDVRAQAVYGLSQQGGVAANSVLQEALQDSDPDVRLMAVDSAGTDELGLALLKQALNDSNETVRGLAANKIAAQANAAAGQ